MSERYRTNRKCYNYQRDDDQRNYGLSGQNRANDQQSDKTLTDYRIDNRNAYERTDDCSDDERNENDRTEEDRTKVDDCTDDDCTEVPTDDTIFCRGMRRAM